MRSGRCSRIWRSARGGTARARAAPSGTRRGSAELGCCWELVDVPVNMQYKFQQSFVLEPGCASVHQHYAGHSSCMQILVTHSAHCAADRFSGDGCHAPVVVQRQVPWLVRAENCGAPQLQPMYKVVDFPFLPQRWMGLSGSRSGPCPCPRFGSQLLKDLACRIVRRNRLWIPLCLRSWRTACHFFFLRSACYIVRGADCGCPRASDHGGRLTDRTTRRYGGGDGAFLTHFASFFVLLRLSRS